MSTGNSSSTMPSGWLALASFDDAMRFATLVAASDFAPRRYRGKPESCLLAIQQGSEIGLSPMQSLRSIACVDGRPAIRSDAALALCLASSVCNGIHETIDGDGDNMTAVCTVSRRGNDCNVVARFSVADAKEAGLWNEIDPCRHYPKRMLQLHARGLALRDAFPDVLKGLAIAEEAQDCLTQRGSVTVLPKGGDPALTVVRLEPDAPVVPEDAAARARLVVSRATSVDVLDAMWTLVDKRMAEGVFTEAQRDDLVDLIHHRAEMLVGDRGASDVPHEAADHLALAESCPGTREILDGVLRERVKRGIEPEHFLDTNSRVPGDRGRRR